MNRFKITNFPLANKTILLRADLDAPLEKNKAYKVSDNRRLRAVLPTIKFLLQNNCRIIVIGHVGRPEGKIIPSLSVKPIAEEFQKLLPAEKISYLNDCLGKDVSEQIQAGWSKRWPKQIFILENLRFYKEEEENDQAFAHSLASLADIYIDDAFANSHRKHASMEAITHYLPSLAGINVEKELQELSKALRPLTPVAWIMGGAKLDKIHLIKKLLPDADYILVGGALAFPFLRAKGFPTGMSKLTPDSVNQAKEILQDRRSSKIILPVDFVAAEKMAPDAPGYITASDNIQTRQIGLDLGPETVKLFKQYLRKAKTIVWNGPLGYFEWAAFANSTKEIGRFIGKLTAISICGGGDTARALQQFHLDQVMTHVSTGGGAALEFLEGNKLAAITALEENYLIFKNKIDVK